MSVVTVLSVGRTVLYIPVELVLAPSNTRGPLRLYLELEHPLYMFS